MDSSGIPPGAGNTRSGIGALARRLSSLRSFTGVADRLQLTITHPGPADHLAGGASEPVATQPPLGTAAPLAAGDAAAGDGAPDGPPPAGPAWQEDVAASAEHHRLTNSSVVSSVDLRQLARSVEKALPFAGLLLLIFVWQHALQILAVTCCNVGLHRANTAMRAQVAKKQEREVRVLSAVAGAALLQLLVVFLLLPRDQIPAVMVLSGKPPATEVWGVFFTVVLADSCIRLLVSAAKAGVLIAGPADTAQRARRRGLILTAVEHVAGVWRGAVPAPLWVRYFGGGGHLGITITTVGCYCLLKGRGLVGLVQVAAAAVRQTGPGGACHGSSPATAEDLAEMGGECAVCQDTPRAPVRLECGHIFCEQCIAEWLERGRNDCPMCRAVVVHHKVASYSDGATPLLPVLF